MLRVPLTHARPGMTLAAPIRHPHRADHVLLQTGFVLDDLSISRLKDLSFHDIWIRYPNLDFIGRYVNPHILEGHAQIAGAMSEIFDRIAADAHAKLDYPAYRSLIRDFLDKLIEEPRAAVFIQEMATHDRPLLRHCSNVCFLSLLMGLKLGGYLVTQRRRLPASRARNVVSLGVGALLHDIGMQRLDSETLARWERTQNENDPQFRKHVVTGFEMVRGRIEPSAAAGVLHHHQRFDGSGFPQYKDDDGEAYGLQRERIHVFARIIATADLFDRLRHPPGSERAVPVVGALAQMQTDEFQRRIDPTTFRALLAVVPAYAPGTLVTLNSGECCVVTEWRPENPCRPVVRTVGDIERDHARSRIDDRTHDLLERTDLFVAVAEGQSVTAHNFQPLPQGQFDLENGENGMTSLSAA